jgi:acetyl esterase/lipase
MSKLICLLLAVTISGAAATLGPIPLWPAGAPGENGGIGAEKDMTTPKDGVVAGKPVIRLGNVSSPTITLYRPVAAKNTGAAVIVFPGGGYRILALDLEGTEICGWLNSIGVTAVLLKYRVPARADLPRYLPPLQDAQRAMGIVRERAAEWGINPARIGVIGFSAGGHLAAALSNNFEKRAYEPSDAADGMSARPDFAMLIYPAYLTVKEEGDKLATELPVSTKTPSTFLVQTEDDGVRVESSLFYYLALKNANVPAEMHLFSAGGHGYGLRATEKVVTGWPSRAEEWLRSIGMVGANATSRR